MCQKFNYETKKFCFPFKCQKYVRIICTYFLTRKSFVNSNRILLKNEHRSVRGKLGYFTLHSTMGCIHFRLIIKLTCFIYPCIKSLLTCLTLSLWVFINQIYYSLPLHVRKFLWLFWLQYALVLFLRQSNNFF